MITLLRAVALSVLLVLATLAQVPRRLAISDGSLTSITVSGRVATVNATVVTGAYVGAIVSVSGSATSSLNSGGQKISTATVTTAFTFNTSAPNGTYTDSNLVVIGLSSNNPSVSGAPPTGAAGGVFVPGSNYPNPAALNTVAISSALACPGTSGSSPTAEVCTQASITACSAGLRIAFTPHANGLPSGTSPTLAAGSCTLPILSNEGVALPLGTLTVASQTELYVNAANTAWVAPPLVPSATGSVATGSLAIGTTVLCATIGTNSGTSLTLAAANNGCVARFTAGTDVTLTIPSGLPVGFTMLIVQRGAGSVIPTAGSGVTLTVSAGSAGKTKTAGNPSVATLVCDTQDNCLLAGDLQ